MKYLKKFKRINESSNEDCDFQTFKDILSDFSDDFRCTFEDYSNLSEEEEPFYDCQMVLVNVDYIDICSNFQYLEDVLPYYDSPDIIENFSTIYNSIDTQIIELEKLRSKLSSMLESNTQLKKIFKTLENEIIPRFEYFSNFNGCSIGLDNGEILRICFEIKI